MKPSSTRKLIVAIALTCAAVQVAFGSSLAAGALTLGIYASHDHGHSLTLQSDGNHFDLVLSHPAADATDAADVPAEQKQHGAYSKGDHVLHVMSAGAVDATSRRVHVDSPPSIACTLAPTVPVAASFSLYSVFVPRARGVEQLRTIVLQL